MFWAKEASELRLVSEGWSRCSINGGGRKIEGGKVTSDGRPAPYILNLRVLDLVKAVRAEYLNISVDLNQENSLSVGTRC